MTKMKSKKMTKSTFAIIIMAIAIVALLAFGGSYAYFTATAKTQTGSVTMGYLKLTANDTFTFSASKVLPGDVVGPTGGLVLTVDITENNDKGAYVAIKPSFGEDSTDLGFELEPGDGWTQIGETGVYYSTNPVKNGNTIAAFVGGFKIPTTVSGNWDEETENAGDSLQGATLSITVESAAIQAANLDSSNVETEIAKLFA